jgi:Mrr N-terminal domain
MSLRDTCLVMKALKLILPQNTYQLASELAMAEEVEIGQFVASVLSEGLSSYRLIQSNTEKSNLSQKNASHLPASTKQAPPPPQRIQEYELIGAIIGVLKSHNGRLEKKAVEEEVFTKYAKLFQHDYYQETVGLDVPRWQKQVQFARNTACNTLGLIKSPTQAGRGIWELTEKGKAWKPN